MTDPHAPHTDTAGTGSGGPIVAIVDRMFASPTRLLQGLGVVCALLVVADFTYHKHFYMDFLYTPLIYPVLGIAFIVGMVIVARVLRALVHRPEEFYAPYGIDAEENGPDATGRNDSAEDGRHG